MVEYAIACEEKDYIKEGQVLIKVEHLVKRYGNRNVVDDLSFTVEKGQIVGFLGPNGAGKSTTMNMITGYISATEGTIEIDGVDIFDEPEKAKKKIGYLPEIPPLYPDMLVREYLNFVCDLKKVKRDKRDQMVSKVMRRTKIADVSERLIKNLSKGYKQRVGFAGAMIGDPEILIFDEPTVGLDPKQILEIRDLIRELSEKHTILLSSHIMQEVSAVCNEIIIINEGKMIVKDTPDHISSHIDETRELIMEVKGNKELVRSTIGAVEHIKEFKVSNTDDEDVCKVSIVTDAEQDVREDVFYALAGNRCAILEMHTKEPTLEESFIRLTGNGSRQMAGHTEKKAKKEAANHESDL